MLTSASVLFQFFWTDFFPLAEVMHRCNQRCQKWWLLAIRISPTGRVVSQMKPCAPMLTQAEFYLFQAAANFAGKQSREHIGEHTVSKPRPAFKRTYSVLPAPCLSFSPLPQTSFLLLLFLNVGLYLYSCPILVILGVSLLQWPLSSCFVNSTIAINPSNIFGYLRCVKNSAKYAR